MSLSGSADRVSVEEAGPGTALSAVLLDEEMRGKYFNQDSPVCDTGDGCLFGYTLANGDLVEGRDRGAMNPKLTRQAVDKLLCAVIEKSPRLRRRLVMELTRGYITPSFDDIRPQKWTARAVELLQQESRIMFEGTVLVTTPAPLCTTMIAEFRDLKPQTCPRALDEGKALVHGFVEELRSLPQEKIDSQDGSASGWASAVREDLIQLTGAKSVASVEFPGKLGAKHVVWVEKDVVLVSRRSLKVDLNKEGVKTARFLLDVISCSMQRDSYFAMQSELPFKVYHLIMSAVHCPEEPPPTLVVNGVGSAPTGLSPGDEGAQVLPAGEGESAGPEVAPSGALSAPAAAASTAAEQAHPEETIQGGGPVGDGENAAPEVAVNGAQPGPTAAPANARERVRPEATAEDSGPADEGEDAAPEFAPNGALLVPAAAASTAHPEAAAEESGEESDGIDGERMEEDEPQDSVERPLCGGKRGCDKEEAEAAAKRSKASESEGGGSASGVPPPGSAQVATVAGNAAGRPTVSVKVEESASSEGQAFASVKLEEPGSSEGASDTAVTPVQPGGSDEVMVLEGLGVSQGAEAAEMGPSVQPPPPPAPISAPERNGEELGAFLSEGDFVPALIHVERRAMGGEGSSLDLYRIAGRKNNKAELSARFFGVMASERATRVLESAVKKPGADISLFCWDEPDALAAFVGQDAERIFVNLHHDPKSVDEWAVDDLPTQIASAMAHVRSATPANVRSHAWSVEFRKWVISEEL